MKLGIDLRPTALGCALFALVGCGNADDPKPTGTAGPASSSASTGGGGGAGVGGAGGSTGIGGSGGANPCSALASQLQQALDDGRASAKSPGAVAAVITPDCGLWEGASGQSTDAAPMDAALALRVGSVTKTFVASTVLELAADGKLGLDDPIETWVAGVPDGTTITVRNLLNHTSGIFNYTDDQTFGQMLISQPKKVWAPQELVDLATAHPASFAPGAGWDYSNTNYILLGMVAEAAGAAALGPQVRTRLLDPTNLASTFFDGEERVGVEMAHGFANDGTDVTTYFDPSYAWSAGAIVATAGDLATWANALYGGTVLPAASLAEMLETVATDTPGMKYGLGVFEYSPQVAGSLAYGHGGDIPGYHTQMLYLVDPKTAIASIVNSDASSPNDITVGILDVVLGL